MRDEASMIFGKNSVYEALKKGSLTERLFVLDKNTDPVLGDIVKTAKKNNVAVSFVTKGRLDELCRNKVHQGVIAYVSAAEYASVDDILKRAEENNELPFIIILDEIVDPHNLGAIIRSANVFGAHGVIIPKHNAAGLTESASKAASGALSYTPVCRVTNLSRTIDELKDKGLWIYCADMDGQSCEDTELTGAIGLVIGNEGKGVSPLVRKKCDVSVSIPMSGEINSLNASVAAGVLMYEITRQRRSAGK